MHDLIIIGAGPAGLTAALYAGRFRLNTLVLERLSVGGQILLSPTIENYPGFPGGITTEKLICRFKEQVEQVGVEIKSVEALGIDPNQEIFEISTNEGIFKSKTIIVATGAQPKRLDILGEQRLTGRGVSYCGTCDGPLFKGKEIAVIGGGDRAIEDALFLAGYADKVNIIHRRNELRASKILVEKAKATPRINFLLENIAEEIIGENRVEALKLRNVRTDRCSTLICQGVFIFVGINPATELVNNFLDKDELGFIITDQEMKTSKPGIFSCGDCCKKSLYQVSTACAEGAVAADSAYKYIINKK